jgi:glycolate oxidase
MSLSREAYRALEDIVGPKYISEEPAIMDSYSYQWLAETVRPNQSKFMPRPEAALLPGSAKEVQAIVKTCNKYKIKIKPYSTGWYFYGAPRTEGVIQIDLRRMDRILDIDEKNMFAVVEPYVIACTLQAEAMKVGLNCTVTGAGASCSTLAGATSYFGTGGSAIYTGELKECLLAVEWVMPNGEFLRTGAIGSGIGWFCGEGPGPSLRGIVRGAFGARGGLGVYTKCAVKLSPWPGPTQFPVEGTVPAYRSPLPKNFRAYTLAFPDWDHYFEAYYRIYDSETGYFAHRQWSMLGTDLGPAFWMLYQNPRKTLDDIEEFAKKPEIKKLTEEMRRTFQLVLVGMSPRDIKYQEKVLDLILAETKGWKVKKWLEPEMEQFALLYLLRLGKKNLNFVYNGGWIGNFMQPGTPDFVKQYRQLAEDVTEPYQEKGLMVDCGSDSMMGTVGSICGGGNCGLEQFGFYDVADKESTAAIIDWMEECLKEEAKHGVPPGKEGMYRAVGKTHEQLQADLAKQPAIHIWQRKIKQAVDPNNLGDPMYPTLDETKNR